MLNLFNICYFIKNEVNQKLMLFLFINDIKVGFCYGFFIFVVSLVGVLFCVFYFYVLDQQGVDFIVEVQEFVAFFGFYYFIIFYFVYR